jgi:hypothetical protein
MAATTVITAQHLALAGITDAALMAALTGLTVAAAADLYLVALQLRIAKEGTDRGGIIEVTLENQTTKFSMESARALVSFLRQMMSTGNGGLSIPVKFI